MEQVDCMDFHSHLFVRFLLLKQEFDHDKLNKIFHQQIITNILIYSFNDRLQR
jgi:hypothetical protein